MNFLNLLIKEKSAVGVEINDLVIRVAYFRPRKKDRHDIVKNNNEKEIILIEETIPVNVISNGVLKDKEILSKILKNIWRKEKLSNKNAIVSIPEDKIYSNLFPFPKTVNDNQLEQAVLLAIDFQLPFSKNDVYIGWENNLNSHNTNEVIISAIPKNIADDYIKAFNDANIGVLALESHIASITRSVKNGEDNTLIIKENQESTTFFISKNNNLKFSRTLPTVYLKNDESILNETEKIKNSFETEYKEKILTLPLTNATIKDEYKNLAQNNSNLTYKWLISIGSALRGEIRKGEDRAISLLPISLSEAYNYQKIKTFIKLIRNMTIGVSIFFLFAYLAAYFFIFSLSQTAKKISTNVAVSQVSADMIEREALIQRMNSLTLVSSSILSSTPNWSILIDEISSRVIDGITISSFAVTNINEKISITGVSSNRDTLNKFKSNLKESMYLNNVELPITNLEQKSDIPFSISFNIKDPNMLYYK